MQKQKTQEYRIGELTPMEWVGRILAYIALTFFGFLMIFPFLYMMFTSFKTSTDVFTYPPRLLPYSPSTTTYEGAEQPVYQFEVDGQMRGLITTGEKVSVGFFTDEANASQNNARESVILAEIAMDEATDLGEVVTAIIRTTRLPTPIYALFAIGVLSSLPLILGGPAAIQDYISMVWQQNQEQGLDWLPRWVLVPWVLVTVLGPLAVVVWPALAKFLQSGVSRER